MVADKGSHSPRHLLRRWSGESTTGIESDRRLTRYDRVFRFISAMRPARPDSRVSRGSLRVCSGLQQDVVVSRVLLQLLPRPKVRQEQVLPQEQMPPPPVEVPPLLEVELAVFSLV